MDNFIQDIKHIFSIQINGQDITQGPKFLSNILDKVIEKANEHTETECYILKVNSLSEDSFENISDYTKPEIPFIFNVSTNCTIITLKPKQLIVCKVDDISITKSLKVSNANLINCLILESHINSDIFFIGKDIVHKETNTIISKESYIVVEVKEVNYNIPEGQITVWGFAIDIPTEEQIEQYYFFDKNIIMKNIINRVQ